MDVFRLRGSLRSSWRVLEYGARTCGVEAGRLLYTKKVFSYQNATLSIAGNVCVLSCSNASMFDGYANFVIPEEYRPSVEIRSACLVHDGAVYKLGVLVINQISGSVGAWWYNVGQNAGGRLTGSIYGEVMWNV